MSNSLHFIVVLQQENVIMLAHYHCQPFLPCEKSSAFVVLTLVVILYNFCNFVGIFELLHYEHGVTSVGKGYKFS